MTKKQKIFIIIFFIVYTIVLIGAIFLPKPETAEVEKIVIQDNILNKLMDEKGINEWYISSYNNDTTFYLTIEFNSIKNATIKIQRNFNSPEELSSNIDSALEEARLLK